MKQLRLIAAFVMAVSVATATSAPHAQASDGVSIFVTGFNNPRGLKFGPDGYLYVAEAGLGGTRSTIGQCPQVPTPPGPYFGGRTARILQVAPNGQPTTVVDHLPSAGTGNGGNNNAEGAADIAFIGDELYVLIAGGGGSHGNPDFPAGVIRVNRHNGTWKLVADLSAFFAAHPVEHPNPGDFEPDGTLFSMVAVHHKLYAIEPNQGRLLEIDPENGKIRQLVDFSASQGHIVPTAVVFDGVFRVGNLSTFPVVPGSAKILDVTKRGRITDEITGFTAITGLALDRDDHLYALELSTLPGRPAPGTGKLVVLKDDQIEEILTGLTLPAGNMAFGPDGGLYLSNISAVPTPGAGQIVRVEVGPTEDTDAD
jgi:hypothetical protein